MRHGILNEHCRKPPSDVRAKLPVTSLTPIRRRPHSAIRTAKLRTGSARRSSWPSPRPGRPGRYLTRLAPERRTADRTARARSAAPPLQHQRREGVLCGWRPSPIVNATVSPAGAGSQLMVPAGTRRQCWAPVAASKPIRSLSRGPNPPLLATTTQPPATQSEPSRDLSTSVSRQPSPVAAELVEGQHLDVRRADTQRPRCRLLHPALRYTGPTTLTATAPGPTPDSRATTSSSEDSAAGYWTKNTVGPAAASRPG